MSAVITLDNVTVRYGAREALRDVSGSFGAGSLTAVAGPNGAGKSTLLKTIAGIIKPSRGSVNLCSECGKKIAYLPQISALRRDFPFSVMDAVCTGFWDEIGEFGIISKEMRKNVVEAIASVGLQELDKRPISSLSGGQFQRMLFARVIVQESRIILLDEPFAAVDAETTAKLIKIMLDWHKDGRTIVCVLHDLMLIRKYFPESFLLAGKCLGRGHTHDLFEQKLLSFDLDMAEIRSPNDKKDREHYHAEEK